VPAEVVSVSSDEVTVLRDGGVVVYRDLAPDSVVVLDELEVKTLPRPGLRISTLATTNDVHFGEPVCGVLGNSAPTFSVPEGVEPYAAMMSRLAVAEIAAFGPDAMVVKGDLTNDGEPEEYEAFLDCYEPTFVDRLTFVRGNHDCYRGQDYASEPFQEITLPGVKFALLDTCRPGHTNGTLSAEQIEQIDELGARADVPVVVLGHHPIWDERTEVRSDNVFSMTPEPSESLLAVFARRSRLVSYAAGHTHRNRVVEIDEIPFVEVASLKDFPGAWCEYQIFDGGILQVIRRVLHPDAIAWSERTRAMFGGTYGQYAYGSIRDRCRLIPTTTRR
jgi:Icc protein